MAIILLGYTLNSDNSIPTILKSRLDKAIDIYQPGTPIICCGKGAPAIFVTDKSPTLTEAEAMGQYLLGKKVRKEDVLLEEDSTSTMTNAFYSYINLVSKLKINSIAVVSNGFHIPLAKYCFSLIYGDKYEIKYISASNEGFTSKEERTWKHSIERLINEAYPILFKNVLKGDIETVSRIIDEAHSVTPSQSRVDFEKKVKSIKAIAEDVNLKGVI